MGEYEYLWNERKNLLVSSIKIGAIIGLCITLVLTITLSNLEVLERIAFFFVTLLGMAFGISIIVVVGRLIFSNHTSSEISRGALAGFMHGIWMTICGLFTSGIVGLFIGLALCLVFGSVFGVVLIGYSIYLPISSIYLYIQYKKEIA